MLREAAISFMPVCQSARNDLAPLEKIFAHFCIGDFYLKNRTRKFMFGQNQTQISDTVHEHLSTFYTADSDMRSSAPGKKNSLLRFLGKT
jgi:hypothetical protein